MSILVYSDIFYSQTEIKNIVNTCRELYWWSWIELESECRSFLDCHISTTEVCHLFQ